MSRKLTFLQGIVRGIFFLVILIALSGSAFAEGAWLTNQATNCKIWDDYPHKKRTFTWTDGCKEGYVSGTGTLQWLESGKPTDKYEGTFVQGKLNGKGVFTSSFVGDRYEGDFVDGKRHGKGVYTLPYLYTYEGDFANNKERGKGIKVYYESGRYEGDFVDGGREGKGIYIWKSGNRYEGDWVDNEMQGYGVKTFADGRVQRGRWEKSKYLGP